MALNVGDKSMYENHYGVGFLIHKIFDVSYFVRRKVVKTESVSSVGSAIILGKRK